jgi:hypothetical protein
MHEREVRFERLQAASAGKSERERRPSCGSTAPT